MSKTEALNIRDIFQNDNFQKLQDAIAIATGLAIITVDYKGMPATTHSSCTNFCKFMRKNTTYSKMCERCDSRGGLEAARTQAPYIYLCHANIVDFAIPIVFNGNYLGAVMAGQVLLPNHEDHLKLEQIYHSFDNNVSFEDTKIFSAYRSIPLMELDKIKTIANMLFSICGLFIEEAKMRFDLEEIKSNYNPSDNVINHELIQENFSEKNNDIYNDNTKKGSSILNPAFDYIRNNFNKDVSLNKVASICNISPTYFSRLFAKQNSGSYKDYINQFRIVHAKRLLMSADMSVNEISEKIGYNDCGYFIKVFKKFVGV